MDEPEQESDSNQSVWSLVLGKVALFFMIGLALDAWSGFPLLLSERSGWTLLVVVTAFGGLFAIDQFLSRGVAPDKTTDPLGRRAFHLVVFLLIAGSMKCASDFILSHSK